MLGNMQVFIISLLLFIMIRRESPIHFSYQEVESANSNSNPLPNCGSTVWLTTVKNENISERLFRFLVSNLASSSIYFLGREQGS